MLPCLPCRLIQTVLLHLHSGSSPTVLSLLAGGDYSLKWWRHSDNQILFQGSYQDLIAGVTDVKQASWDGLGDCYNPVHLTQRRHSKI